MPSPFFADAVNSDNWPVYLAIILTAWLALQAYEKIDAIRNRNKKTPPDHEVYATKPELENVERRVNKRIDEGIGGIKTHLDKMDQSMQAELRSVNRSLGRLEGPTKT